MSEDGPPVPETRVLAVASHVGTFYFILSDPFLLLLFLISEANWFILFFYNRLYLGESNSLSRCD